MQDSRSATFPSLETLRAEPAGLAMARARQAIRDAEPEVRAWAYLPETWPEGSEQPGPLAGVPFGVKDVINVAGMPTQCGSASRADTKEPFDAASVQMLRRAGAVPIGKTVTAEYAFRHPGPTRNPANLNHTPGGSSSGSAAAVAAGMVPLALSTQTGGSIIRPAAYCGVPGYKPSFGLLSRDGLKLTCDSLDVIGWHGADLAWVRAGADVLLPKSPSWRAPSLQGAKVAVIEDGAEGSACEESRAILERVVALVQDRGASCARVDASRQLAALSKAHAVIMTYEFARALQPVVQTHAEQLSPALLANVAQGWAVSDTEYLEMRALQREMRASWQDFTGGADFILGYSATGQAPEGHAFTGAPVFNKGWSVLGWPCLHLPVAPSRRGLPLGVQLVGQFEADFDLLAYGAQLELLFQ